MPSGLTRTGLIGAAGEYYVAAQLSQRGWLATITIKNSPGTDVLAQHSDTGILIAIQSKTTNGDGWVLGVKDEAPTDQGNSWYVLVSLRGENDRPDFYVLPRNQVAALLWVGHRNWLRTPGKGGMVRRDNPMRNIYPAEIQPYKEDWAALLGSTSARPWVLPDWFAKHAVEIGFPPGHPDVDLFGPATGVSR